MGHFGIEVFHELMELPGGSDGPHRIVFVDVGNAKDSHHRVADILLDGAVVFGDDLRGMPEDPAHYLPNLLRVQPLAHRRVAAQIGEEHRDQLALAFGVRNRERLTGSLRRFRQCLATLQAELCLRGIIVLTTWALHQLPQPAIRRFFLKPPKAYPTTT